MADDQIPEPVIWRIEGEGAAALPVELRILAERYLAECAGDPLSALLVACEDVSRARRSVSAGFLRERPVHLNRSPNQPLLDGGDGS